MSREQILEKVNLISEWAHKNAHVGKMLRSIDFMHPSGELLEFYAEININIDNEAELYAAMLASKALMIQKKRYQQYEVSFPVALHEFSAIDNVDYFNPIIRALSSVDFATLISRKIGVLDRISNMRLNIVQLWEDVLMFESNPEQVRAIWVREYYKIGGMSRKQFAGLEG